MYDGKVGGGTGLVLHKRRSGGGSLPENLMAR